MKNFKKLMVFVVLALITVPVFSSADGFNAAGEPVDHSGRTIGKLSIKHFLSFAKMSPLHARAALDSFNVKHLSPEALLLVENLAFADAAGHSAILAREKAETAPLFEKRIYPGKPSISEARIAEILANPGGRVTAKELAELRARGLF